MHAESDVGSTAGVEELVDGLSALSRALVGITARALASLNVEVTLSQYRTLVILASRGPLRTVDLAAALHVHPSTATRTCNRLVRRDLVARHHRPSDRRVALLTLTAAGKTLVGDVMRHRTQEIRQLVRTVGSEPQTTAELINSLVIAAGEPTEEQWWHHWEQIAR
ncbi:MarR family winged helix-turn-helix transcriptional regulator [Micromonospora vinacea]|uniref:MarR family winged helix-turn-helix transcriptional regulator n=1 Tax=Micromonospora TaxID=1873 RepID=UPI0035582709